MFYHIIYREKETRFCTFWCYRMEFMVPQKKKDHVLRQKPDQAVGQFETD